MDDTGIPTTPSPPSDLDSLREQYESLRHLVVSLLVLGIVVTGAFDLFLLREVKYARSDLGIWKPQADQLMAEYQKGRGQSMDDFVRKIVYYGQTNKDFTPIM